MNGVYDKHKGDSFYQYIWGYFNDIILQRYDIFITLVKYLMYYFDVILLSDDI